MPTLTIDLPAETERPMRETAERRGVPAPAYALALIQRDLAREWNDEAAQHALTAGFGRVATLGLGQGFDWERRQEYAEALAAALRERWPELRRGWTIVSEQPACIEMQFTLLPESAPPPDELRGYLQDRWRRIAGPEGTAAVVDVRGWLRQLPGSADEFLQEKHEEARQEEKAWQRHWQGARMTAEGSAAC